MFYLTHSVQLGFFCRVTESKHPDYPVGSEWLYRSGWRSHNVVNPAEAVKQGDTYPSLLSVTPMGDLPHSLSLGTLGMPGYVLQRVFELKYIRTVAAQNFCDGLLII